MGGYEVDHEALASHEQDVRQTMEQISGAAGSAGSLWNPSAFGILGETWAGILSNWTNSATSFINSAVSAGNGVADGVRTMRENYQKAEDGNQRSFTDIHNGVQEK